MMASTLMSLASMSLVSALPSSSKEGVDNTSMGQEAPSVQDDLTYPSLTSWVYHSVDGHVRVTCDPPLTFSSLPSSMYPVSISIVGDGQRIESDITFQGPTSYMSIDGNVRVTSSAGDSITSGPTPDHSPNFCVVDVARDSTSGSIKSDAWREDYKEEIDGPLPNEPDLHLASIVETASSQASETIDSDWGLSTIEPLHFWQQSVKLSKLGIGRWDIIATDDDSIIPDGQDGTKLFRDFVSVMKAPYQAKAPKTFKTSLSHGALYGTNCQDAAEYELSSAVQFLSKFVTRWTVCRQMPSIFLKKALIMSSPEMEGRL